MREEICKGHSKCSPAVAATFAERSMSASSSASDGGLPSALAKMRSAPNFSIESSSFLLRLSNASASAPHDKVSESLLYRTLCSAVARTAAWQGAFRHLLLKLRHR